MTRTLLGILLVVAGPVVSASAFSLNLTFSGGVSASQQTIFNEAKAIWEGYITGYQPGINRTGLDVTIMGQAIDGVGGTLGWGGPSTGSSIGGYVIANEGAITVDSADLAQLEAGGELDELALHELAHVLGFGTLWTHNGVHSEGSEQYTGAFALAAYQDEFDPLATYVPVEQEGGSGTADGHWNEVNLGGGLTGITDSYGRDLANELMTGWTGPYAPTGGETFLSDTTIMSFRDIGFDVQLTPEPSTAILAVLIVFPALCRRNRGIAQAKL